MLRVVHSIAPRRAVARVVSIAVLVAALTAPTVGRSGTRDAGLEVVVVAADPTSITIAWDVDDAPGLRFVVLLDGEHVAATTKTEYTISDLGCGRAYEVEVVRVDPVRSRSERAAVVTATARCPEPSDTAVETAPAPRAAPPEDPVRAPAPDRLAPEPTPIEPSSPSATLWQGAGAFVWHETDVSPEALGRELRESGFAWVAVRIHDGLSVDPIEDDWARRFRAESGLPVGGWGVLRADPEGEAALANELVDRYALDFYIANPEAEYKFSGDDGTSEERFGRSARFVNAFRLLAPQVDAAVSSYCRADRQDLDWRSWSRAGFAFLPQAYVNDFGSAASPAACASGATGFFDSAAVHPTIGVYQGPGDAPDVTRYASLLEDAGTVGFSVYLAETDMTARKWRILGDAIAGDAVARHGVFVRERTTPALDRTPASTPAWLGAG